MMHARDIDGAIDDERDGAWRHIDDARGRSGSHRKKRRIMHARDLDGAMDDLRNRSGRHRRSDG